MSHTIVTQYNDYLCQSHRKRVLVPQQSKKKEKQKLAVITITAKFFASQCRRMVAQVVPGAVKIENFISRL